MLVMSSQREISQATKNSSDTEEDADTTSQFGKISCSSENQDESTSNKRKVSAQTNEMSQNSKKPKLQKEQIITSGKKNTQNNSELEKADIKEHPNFCLSLMKEMKEARVILSRISTENYYSRYDKNEKMVNDNSSGDVDTKLSIKEEENKFIESHVKMEVNSSRVQVMTVSLKDDNKESTTLCQGLKKIFENETACSVSEINKLEENFDIESTSESLSNKEINTFNKDCTTEINKVSKGTEIKDDQMEFGDITNYSKEGKSENQDVIEKSGDEVMVSDESGLEIGYEKQCETPLLITKVQPCLEIIHDDRSQLIVQQIEKKSPENCDESMKLEKSAHKCNEIGNESLNANKNNDLVVHSQVGLYSDQSISDKDLLLKGKINVNISLGQELKKSFESQTVCDINESYKQEDNFDIESTSASRSNNEINTFNKDSTAETKNVPRGTELKDEPVKKEITTNHSSSEEGKYENQNMIEKCINEEMVSEKFRLEIGYEKQLENPSLITKVHPCLEISHHDKSQSSVQQFEEKFSEKGDEPKKEESTNKIYEITKEENNFDNESTSELPPNNENNSSDKDYTARTNRDSRGTELKDEPMEFEDITNDSNKGKSENQEIIVKSNSEKIVSGHAILEISFGKESENPTLITQVHPCPEISYESKNQSNVQKIAEKSSVICNESIEFEVSTKKCHDISTENSKMNENNDLFIESPFNLTSEQIPPDKDDILKDDISQSIPSAQESEISIESESLCSVNPNSEMNLSNKDDTADSHTVPKGQLKEEPMEFQDVTKYNLNHDSVRPIESQAATTSQQIFPDQEKMEHKVTENNKKTMCIRPNDLHSKRELVPYQPDEMEISDNEENEENTDEHVFASSQSSEKEYFQSSSYKSLVMDDPIWRDRLPPPPGCESPPPPPGCETPPSSLPTPTTHPSSLPTPTTHLSSLTPPTIHPFSLPPPTSLMLQQSKYSMKSYLDIAAILESATKNSSDQFEVEFEINRLPKFTLEYVVKKGLRENKIKECSGAVAFSKGKYIAPEEDSLSNVRWMKTLHLHITGRSLKILQKALKCVQGLIGEGEEDQSIKMVCIYELPSQEMDAHAPPGFSVIDRLLGEGGANLKYIMEQTGAEVTLRGQGSGHLDLPYGSEAPRPLHLRIRHITSEGLNSATELALNLVQVTASFSNQSADQMATAALPAMMPTIGSAILAPLPALSSTTASHSSSIPSLFTPTFVTTASSTSLFAGANSTSVPSFLPSKIQTFCSPVAQLGLQASLPPQETKVVYEAAPQLKSNNASSSKSIVISAAGNLSIPLPRPQTESKSSFQTAPSVSQFAKPTPPLPRPHPKPVITYLRTQPSSSSTLPSPEQRKGLTFTPQYKKEEIRTEAKKSTKDAKEVSKISLNADKKPKKIHFSIISATKSGKVLSASPLALKKMSSDDSDQSPEAEQSNSPTQISEAATECSSSQEKKSVKTSRWGQGSEEIPQPYKVHQLLNKWQEQISNLPSEEDKNRWLKMFKLLQSAVPHGRKINDQERSQLKLLMETFQKTLKYLPSNQISKTLWEILSILKTEFDIVTGDKSSDPHLTFDKKTEALMNEVRSFNEVSARETGRKDDEKSIETLDKQKRDSHKSSSNTKSYGHSTRSSPSRREFHRTYSNRKSDSPMSGKILRETKRSFLDYRERKLADSSKHESKRGESKKSSSDNKERRLTETSTQVPKRGETKRSSSDNKERKLTDTSTQEPKRGETIKYSFDKESKLTNTSTQEPRRGETKKYSSDNKERKLTDTSTEEPKWGETKKYSLDNEETKTNETNRWHKKFIEVPQSTSLKIKYDSGLCEAKQETMKTVVKSEDSSLKPTKSIFSGRINQVVELLHLSLKTATNSLENVNVKLELSKIAQLLEHALPPGVEASDEQKSQFLIVLEVLEQSLERNAAILGDKSDHFSSIIAVLKNLLSTTSASVSQCQIRNDQKTSPSITTRICSETINHTETKQENKSGQRQLDQLSVITQLLQKAIRTYADSLEQSIMKTQLISISHSLEDATSKSGKTTEKEQTSLLQVIGLLEQLLTTSSSPSSCQPNNLLGIMKTLKQALQSMQVTLSPKSPNVEPTFLTNQQQSSPKTSNQPHPQLLEIVLLLQKTLHSYSSCMEPGYLKAQLTQISQLLDRELQEYASTMSPEQLKKQMTPLVQLLKQLLQNQPTSNNELKKLLQILELTEKSVKPVTSLNPTQNSMLGFEQLQMLSSVPQQMQSGLQLGMGLPFNPLQMQTAPMTNNMLQLQLMQQMQQMQATLASQMQQPANAQSDQITRLSQQLLALQQQITQISQLNQQQPFRTAAIPQQPQQQSLAQHQPFVQSLFSASPQPFVQTANVAQPQSTDLQRTSQQSDLSSLMLQFQQASQKFKGSE